MRSVKTGAGEAILISWRYIYRDSDKSLAQPGRKQTNDSVRMDVNFLRRLVLHGGKIN